MPVRLWLLTLGWALLHTSVSCAQSIVFSFTPDGTPTTFTVSQGQTVNIPVYVIERRTTAGVPNTPAQGGDILRNEGLLSAGVRLNFSTTAGSATATVATPNPLFDVNTFNFPGVGLGFASVSSTTTNLAGVQASGNTLVVSTLVGTFAFQGNQVGNVTTLSTAKPQLANFSELVSNMSLTILDAQAYANLFGGTPSATTTLTTTPAVPEPTGLLLTATVGAGWSVWRRRGWRK